MWLLPTLDRVDKLRNFLKSAINAKTSTPGLIITDNDDYAKNKDGYQALALPENWSIRVTKAITMGDKVREVWDHVKHRNWLAILNDDHFCITEHWDVKLLSRLDGKNFVSANDRWIAPRKATTATAWSMDLLNAVGWPIFPPGLNHLFIDDIWEHLGKNTGCWWPVMSAVVEHHHVINGKGAEDDTHHKVYNQKAWDTDNAIFQNFIKHDLGPTVEKIIKFQDMTMGQRYNPLNIKNSFIPNDVNPR